MTSPPPGASGSSGFAPFHEGLRRGEIRFPVCQGCGHVEWYPMARCTRCYAEAFDWRPVRGPGRLWSWTVVRRDFSGGKGPELPYIVGLVAFDEVPGTRLITNLVECEEGELVIDGAVEPVFVTPDDEAPRVLFRPVPAKESAA